MFSLQELIGLIVCVGPALVVVTILIQMSRRPKCPNCHRAISPAEAACTKCGHSLAPRSGS